jgi:hypothetical protein
MPDYLGRAKAALQEVKSEGEFGLPSDEMLQQGFDGGTIPTDLLELCHLVAKWAFQAGREFERREGEAKANAPAAPAEIDLAAEEERYIAWYSQKSKYWQPNDAQREKMFEACRKLQAEPGIAKIYFNYAVSFSVVLKNDQIVDVFRDGHWQQSPDKLVKSW